MTEYTSRSSIPVTISNVLDPISVNAQFVYNFYVPNEDKEYSPNRRSPIDYNSGLVSQQTVESIEANSRGSLSARVPRYIKISISPKSSDQEWDSLPLLDSSIELKIRNTNGSAKIENINLEGEIQNRYIANPSIVDSSIKNRLQREVYTSSEAIIRDGGIFGDMSDEKLSKEMSLSLSDEIDETIILDSLSDSGPKGQKFVNEIVSERYSRIETRSKIQHKVNFNAGTFRNTLSPVCVGNPFSAYFEVDSLGSSAPNAGINRNGLFDEISFPSIKTTDPDENKQPRLAWIKLTPGSDEPPTTENASQFSVICSQFPRINHIGYIVEKYSASPTGRYETHPSQVLFGRLSTEFIDPNIKYGYTYFYRVRQLYLSDILQVESIFSEIDSLGRSVEKISYRILTSAIASSSPPAARVVARETDVPNPPSVLVAEYIHRDGHLRLEWSHPSNPSRDIKKYQVFRRKNLRSPFELIVEYNFLDEGYTAFIQTESIDPSLIVKINTPRTYHIDRDFDTNSSFIYCIASVDAHGLCSNYGTQIQVNFNRQKNNIETRIISRSGSPKAYPNYYVDPTELEEFGSDRLVEDVIKDSGHGTLKIYFNPDAYRVQSDDISTSEMEPLVLSQQKGRYKMQIINLDRQISRTLEASIVIDPSLNSIL